MVSQRNTDQIDATQTNVEKAKQETPSKRIIQNPALVEKVSLDLLMEESRYKTVIYGTFLHCHKIKCQQ